MRGISGISGKNLDPILERLRSFRAYPGKSTANIDEDIYEWKTLAQLAKDLGEDLAIDLGILFVSVFAKLLLLNPKPYKP